MDQDPNRVLIETAAQHLRTASESGVPCSPVREILGTDSDVELAYAVAQHNISLDVAAGRRVSGRKIGLTGVAIQRQLGVTQPDYGALFADMCIADGLTIPASRLMQPRAEAEIAFVLEHDLDKGEHCVVDVIGATAYLLGAIEVVASRVVDWDITIVDTIADNASCGLYVVGSRPVSLASVNVRDISMTLTVNDEVATTGQGSACMGNPLHAVVWLADVMCRAGTPLRAGDCLMTGSLGSMVPISPGDRVVTDMGPLGTVSTTLE